jgi:hypothetical protein
MADINSYFPSYNGTNNADDPLVTPWWIPGWTSQNRTEAAYEIEASSESITGPGFPTNLSFVRVTGNYFDGNSSGIAGYVTCYMSDSITVTDNDVTYRLPQRLTGSMNFPSNLAYNNFGSGQLFLGRGRLDITLFATDQTTAGATITTDSGAAFGYWVTEHFPQGQQYQIQVPSGDASTTDGVDIHSLIVSGSINPHYRFDPTWPAGNSYIPETVPGWASAVYMPPSWLG